jgi:hypothetical protein
LSTIAGITGLSPDMHEDALPDRRREDVLPGARVRHPGLHVASQAARWSGRDFQRTRNVAVTDLRGHELIDRHPGARRARVAAAGEHRRHPGHLVVVDTVESTPSEQWDRSCASPGGGSGIEPAGNRLVSVPVRRQCW